MIFKIIITGEFLLKYVVMSKEKECLLYNGGVYMEYSLSNPVIACISRESRLKKLRFYQCKNAST